MRTSFGILTLIASAAAAEPAARQCLPGPFATIQLRRLQDGRPVLCGDKVCVAIAKTEALHEVAMAVPSREDLMPPVVLGDKPEIDPEICDQASNHCRTLGMKLTTAIVAARADHELLLGGTEDRNVVTILAVGGDARVEGAWNVAKDLRIALQPPKGGVLKEVEPLGNVLYATWKVGDQYALTFHDQTGATKAAPIYARQGSLPDVHVEGTWVLAWIHDNLTVIDLKTGRTNSIAMHEHFDLKDAVLLERGVMLVMSLYSPNFTFDWLSLSGKPRVLASRVVPTCK